MESDRRKAREIQKSIGKILWEDWDPIGVNHMPELSDEYDAYVGRIYRALATDCSLLDLMTLLHSVEFEDIGLSCSNTLGLDKTANKLLELNISLDS